MAASLSKSERKLIEQARRWVVRLTSGDMTEHELQRFRKWVSEPEHDRVFRREMTAWRRLGQLQGALEGPIDMSSFMAFKRRSRVRKWQVSSVAVAAAIALMAAGPNMLLRMRADHISYDSVDHVELPDGSRAILDAGAAIAVRYGEEERRVELLHGRAWFDVRHKERVPFRVSANGGTIEDIGTAFEVALVGDRVETAVSEGRVRVTSPFGAPVELAAGQRAGYLGGAPVEREADVSGDKVAPWRKGNLVLEGISVRQAVAEVARYRSGPTWVWGQIRETQPITVVLRSSEPEVALNALAESADLALIRLPGGVVIVRQPSSR